MKDDESFSRHDAQAARILRLLAEINGQYVWQSMSETHYHALTEDRKADMLSAYRSWCAYRDGRMTFAEAWADIVIIAARANVGNAPAKSRRLTRAKAEA